MKRTDSGRSNRCVVCVAEGAETDDVGDTEAEGDGVSVEGCIDRDGASVLEGALFKPDPDPCIECTCREGRQTLCVAIACQPPSCEWEQIEGECCQFRCLDAGDQTIPAEQCTSTA